MAPQQRLQLRLNLGRDADIHQVVGALADIQVVCSFGGALQRLADRNQVIYDLARRNGPYVQFGDDESFEDQKGRFRTQRLPWLVVPEMLSLEVNRLVDSILLQRESEQDARVQIESVSYRNPLDVVILAGGLVVLRVLVLVRDWRSRRRLNDAQVAEYESAAQAREEVRQHIIRGLDTGEYRLTSEQITRMLTTEVAASMRALGEGGLELEELGGVDDENE